MASVSSTDGADNRQSHSASFAKVFDGRKQPIRAFVVRNGRHYALISAGNAHGRQQDRLNGSTRTESYYGYDDRGSVRYLFLDMRLGALCKQVTHLFRFDARR